MQNKLYISVALCFSVGPAISGTHGHCYSLRYSCYMTFGYTYTVTTCLVFLSNNIGWGASLFVAATKRHIFLWGKIIKNVSATYVLKYCR